MKNKKFEYICKEGQKVLTKCYCDKDKKVVVENDVSLIGPYAFSQCELEEIVLPHSLEKIYDYAFCNCKNLKCITIARGVLDHPYSFTCNMGNEVFYGCENIEKIRLNDEAALYRHVENYPDFMRELLIQVTSFEGNYEAKYMFTPNILEEALIKKKHKLTLEIDFGPKILLAPKFIRDGSLYGYTNHIKDCLSDWRQKDRTINDFFCIYMQNSKNRMLSAIEMYMFEKDKTVKEFIYLHFNGIHEYLANEKYDGIYAQLVNLNLIPIPPNKVKDIFEDISKKNMPISKAYLLQTMKKVNEDDSANFSI